MIINGVSLYLREEAIIAVGAYAPRKDNDVSVGEENLGKLELCNG